MEVTVHASWQGRAERLSNRGGKQKIKSEVDIMTNRTKAGAGIGNNEKRPGSRGKEE